MWNSRHFCRWSCALQANWNWITVYCIGIILDSYKLLHILVCKTWLYMPWSWWLKPSRRFSSFDFYKQSIQDCPVWPENFLSLREQKLCACVSQVPYSSPTKLAYKSSQQQVWCWNSFRYAKPLDLAARAMDSPAVQALISQNVRQGQEHSPATASGARIFFTDRSLKPPGSGSGKPDRFDRKPVKISQIQISNYRR